MRRFGQRFRWRVAVAGGIVALVIVALVAIMAPPVGWSLRRAADANTAREGEALERGLTSIATRVTDDDGETAPTERLWAVRISESQLNAWLATRLPAWMAHAGESRVPTISVSFHDDQVRIAIRDSGGTIVHGVTVAPTIVDGALEVRLVGTSVGRLPIPTTLLRSAIPTSILESAEEFGLDASGPENLWRIAEFDLGDGRRVTFDDIEVRSGEVRLAAKTVRSEP